ncbi:MAG: GDP-mannose 4,6-dehydratase [candidate division WOR-3 bacterium]|nr:MAG: GDP-mannose 4,6-dehydratase [candidate division WOR-3 bacterium]
MKTLLVTGSEGFVGSHLIKALDVSKYEVVAACLPQLIPKKGKYVALDVLNLDLVFEVFKQYQPDVVFHLAAVSSVAKSFRDRPIVYSTNIAGTANLLEAARSLGKKTIFYFVSTCEVYGGGEHLNEDAPVVLKNPYAISKYAAELIVTDYQVEGLDCVVLRPFTHTGPGQAETFVLPTIAKQIGEIEKGKRAPLIELGNVKAKREFMNIKDVVAAYTVALEMCAVGQTYNIATGHGYTISELVDIFKRLSRKEFELKVNPTRMRKNDIPVLIGDGGKFSGLTGWSAKVKVEKTIEDLLNYWRAKV